MPTSHRLAALTAVALALALPTSAAASPRAWVVTVHGGGWHEVGPAAAARMDADRARLHRWGYGTVNVDYRAGPHAFPDVLAAYDGLRRRVGPAAPICAMGASAGGQLVLMLAIRRPEVACVVTHAAPTVLSSLAARLRAWAKRAFGPFALDDWSPAYYRLRTPLLIEHAVRDPLVGFSDAVALHDAAARSRLIALRAGDAPWTHARVDAAQLAAARGAERRLIRRWTARWHPGAVAPAAYAGPLAD